MQQRDRGRLAGAGRADQRDGLARQDGEGEVFDRRAITIVMPDADAQEYVHEKYMTELISGVVLEETREGLLKIVKRLKTEQGIEGLILGGTELSLILKDGDDADIPFLDTTHIHARSAVRELLRRE